MPTRTAGTMAVARSSGPETVRVGEPSGRRTARFLLLLFAGLVYLWRVGALDWGAAGRRRKAARLAAGATPAARPVAAAPAPAAGPAEGAAATGGPTGSAP